jgi:hypothetical protein
MGQMGGRGEADCQAYTRQIVVPKAEASCELYAYSMSAETVTATRSKSKFSPKVV